MAMGPLIAGLKQMLEERLKSWNEAIELISFIRELREGQLIFSAKASAGHTL